MAGTNPGPICKMLSNQAAVSTSRGWPLGQAILSCQWTGMPPQGKFMWYTCQPSPHPSPPSNLLLPVFCPTGKPPQLVSVPTHFYKVVLAENKSGKHGSHSAAVGAFVLPNAPIDPAVPLSAYTVPLEALESVAGELLGSHYCAWTPEGREARACGLHSGPLLSSDPSLHVTLVGFVAFWDLLPTSCRHEVLPAVCQRPAACCARRGSPGLAGRGAAQHAHAGPQQPSQRAGGDAA